MDLIHIKVINWEKFAQAPLK